MNFSSNPQLPYLVISLLPRQPRLLVHLAPQPEYYPLVHVFPAIAASHACAEYVVPCVNRILIRSAMCSLSCMLPQSEQLLRLVPKEDENINIYVLGVNEQKKGLGVSLFG